MDASAELWYGVWENDLPEEALLVLDSDEDQSVQGVSVRQLFSGEVPVGVGGIIADTIWDQDRQPLDLASIEVVKAVVDSFLDEYQIPGQRGVYLLASWF